MDMNHDKQHSVHTHHVQFVVNPPAARGLRGAKQRGSPQKHMMFGCPRKQKAWPPCRRGTRGPHREPIPGVLGSPSQLAQARREVEPRLPCPRGDGAPSWAFGKVEPHLPLPKGEVGPRFDRPPHLSFCRSLLLLLLVLLPTTAAATAVAAADHCCCYCCCCYRPLLLLLLLLLPTTAAATAFVAADHCCCCCCYRPLLLVLLLLPTTAAATVVAADHCCFQDRESRNGFIMS